MKINREAFISAIIAALTAERDGAQKMDPCIGFYRNGNEIVCRYESALSPTDRIHRLSWDTQGFGITDRIADMTGDQIRKDAAAVFDIFGDEILDVLDGEY